MKKLLCGLSLLVYALVDFTLADAASVTLGQAGIDILSAIITPDPDEVGKPANIWIGGLLNGTLYLRNGASAWVPYSGGPLPVGQTSAALPSSLEVTIVNADVSSVPGLDIYVGYGRTEADLSLSGHLAKVYTTVPTPTPTPVGVANGNPTNATIGSAGGSLSTPDGKIALSIPTGALASNTQISIQPLTNTAHGKVGAAYRLTPEGQTFLTPVTFTFTYTDQDLVGTAADFLGVAFQTADGYWQLAGDATIDTTAKTVRVTSNHFSVYTMVKDLQLVPASKSVKTGGTVGLQVVNCYAPGVPDDQGINCDVGDDLPYLLPPNVRVTDWSVNGVPGGGGAPGTVRGSGATAIFTAPGTKPTPDTVAVSARVDRRGTGSKTLVVSNITITQESWTGTATSVHHGSVFDITLNAQVTWNLIGSVDNVAVFSPTGTATITAGVHGVPCTIDSVVPSSGLITETNGTLTIDYNQTPPTYLGYGFAFWPATITMKCQTSSGTGSTTTSVFAGQEFLGGTGGPLGDQAAGAVSADGATIAGSGPYGPSQSEDTITYRFTRNQ